MPLSTFAFNFKLRRSTRDLFIPCLFIPVVYWMGGLRATPEAGLLLRQSLHRH
jgi:hypothetical protein